jgi:hypothetical protein
MLMVCGLWFFAAFTVRPRPIFSPVPAPPPPQKKSTTISSSYRVEAESVLGFEVERVFLWRAWRFLAI